MTRRWAKSLAVAAAATAILTLAGCVSGSGSASTSSANSSATPRQGGTLTLSAGGDPLAIDPALIESGLGTQISAYMAETLTTYFHNGKLEPLLATSWKPNATGTAWTFTLRQGVKFQDGTPFNASAVQQNIKRLLDPSLKVVTSNDVGRFTKSVTVVNDNTVTFNLKQPVSYFPEALSNQTTAMTSPKSWTAAGNSYTESDHVVGTGPYKLVNWDKNVSITLARNDNYWGKEAYYKQQVFKFIPDANARETALRAGQIQVATGLPTADLDSMKSDSSLNVKIGSSTRINYMAFNTTSTVDPLLQKPAVRQALNYAVDKNAIVKNILFGAGTVDTSPVIAGATGECTTGPYPYDPSKAKQMLAAAGASNLSITIITPNGRFLQDMQTAQAVAGYFRAVGVKVKGPLVQDNATNQAIIVAPPATSNSDPNDELFLWSFGADFPHASQQLGNLYLSTSIPPNSGLNFSHYSNPTVDSLTLKADSELNATQAAQDYCSAEKQVWNDAPVIFLFTAGFPVVSSSQVGGITIAPNSIVNTVWAFPTN